ncbi:MAG: hypothetical protein AAF449_00770 [Myxococcota bacterium]
MEATMQAPAPASFSQEASPEEQASYDQLVGNALVLAFDKERLPSVLKGLRGGDDPIEGLSRTAANIFVRVAKDAEANGVPLAGEVSFAAGTEIVESLAELSTAAGIHDFENDAEALEGAYFRALDHARVMMQQSGGLSQETAQQDMARLQAMDESGELERMMVGLAESDVPAAPDPRTRGLMGAMA